MIKIEKVLANGRLLGRKDDDWYYLFKGFDTESQLYANLIVKKEELDESPSLEEKAKERIVFVLEHKITKEYIQQKEKETNEKRNKV